MSTRTSFVQKVAILITDSKGTQRGHILKSEQGVFIGRSSNCGIQLPEAAIADIQCRVELSEGVIRITRWLSTQGVFINQRELDDEAELNANDVVTIGAYEIRVNVPNQQQKTLDIQSTDHRQSHLEEEKGLQLRDTLKSDQSKKEPLTPSDENKISAFALSGGSLKPLTGSNEKSGCRFDEMKDVQSLIQNPFRAAQHSNPKNEFTAESDKHLGNPTAENDLQSDLIEMLRREITSLQNQLRTFVNRNAELEKQLSSLTKQKREDTLQTRIHSSNNPGESPSSQSESPNAASVCTPALTHLSLNANKQTAKSSGTTYSVEGRGGEQAGSLHQYPKTKSLTNKRLSNVSGNHTIGDKENKEATEISPDRIQALRHQLRQQYEADRTTGTIFGRFTQLWK